ncbi:ankyrin repeat domain-containing protein 17 [Biomphalaria glabrata]|nr:ankyrin repeat domain-containing protein 17 [Biomphalaria glabrata]
MSAVILAYQQSLKRQLSFNILSLLTPDRPQASMAESIDPESMKKLAKIVKHRSKRLVRTRSQLKALNELDNLPLAELRTRREEDTSRDSELDEMATSNVYTDVENLLSQNQDHSQEALNKSLMLVAKSGRKLNLIQLLNRGADPNTTDKEKNTPLMFCARQGLLEMVRILLNKGANASMRNARGDTALILAIRMSGSADMARLLCRHDNVDLKNNRGYTALRKAVESADIGAMQVLISNGANVSDSKDGETIRDLADKLGLLKFVSVFCDGKASQLPRLCAAVMYRDFSLMSTLIALDVSDINQRGSGGKTALETLLDLVLVENKGLSSVDKDILKLLIDNGSDVNVKVVRRSKQHKRMKSCSPLLKAVEIGDVDVVKWLCSKGAKINEFTSFEQLTPLMMAAKDGKPEIVRYLLSIQADDNIRNSEGTALEIAVKCKQLECVTVFLEQKAEQDTSAACQMAIGYKELCLLEELDKNFTIDYNDTRLLEWAILSGRKDILLFLLSKGMDSGARLTKPYYVSFHAISTSVCPLHLCVMEESKDLMEALLQHNADINIVDANGDTPLVHASANRDSRFLETLLKHGADVNLRNRWGEAPISIAVENSIVENVRLLLDAGAEYDFFDQSQKSPLSSALETGNLELAFIFIDKGVNTDVVLRDGDSYLTLLLKKLQFEDDLELAEDMIELLLRQNLDIHRRDRDNSTAFILACKSEINCPAIKKLLLDQGSDVNAINALNDTALSVAMQKEDLDMVRTLLERQAKFHLAPHVQEAAHLFIVRNQIDMLYLAFGKGIYPHCASRGQLFYNVYNERCRLRNVSPFLLAMLQQKFDLATFLLEIRFLTKFDVTTFLSMDFFIENFQRRKLVQGELFDGLLSLKTLSFVHVSDLLGATSDREIKVNQLPIPNKIKQELLFEDVPNYVIY